MFLFSFILCKLPSREVISLNPMSACHLRQTISLNFVDNKPLRITFAIVRPGFWVRYGESGGGGSTEKLHSPHLFQFPEPSVISNSVWFRISPAADCYKIIPLKYIVFIYWTSYSSLGLSLSLQRWLALCGSVWHWVWLFWLNTKWAPPLIWFVSTTLRVSSVRVSFFQLNI